MNFEPLNSSLIAKHERFQHLAAFPGFNTNVEPPRILSHPNDPPTDIASQTFDSPLSEIANQSLGWLWPQRIPLGKLTLLDGQPGSGTSLLALTLAASISSGRPLPGVSAAEITHGNVLLIAPHDDASDTIKPRLEAAGGDPSHVFVLNTVAKSAASPTAAMTERPFCLADDLALLEATIQRHSAVLVIIDPLHTVLGPACAHSSSQHSSRPHPRTLLFSLARLAQRTGCAFLLIRSVRIRRSDLRHPCPTGSPDIVSAARSGLFVTCDPDDAQTRLLLPTKHPLSQPPAILAYQVVEHTMGVPTIRWLEDGEHILDSLLETGPSRSAQRQTIFDFLNECLIPISPRDLSNSTGCNYERARKMMQRMHKEGELVSPARGLYTTPSHPCLADIPIDVANGPEYESGIDFMLNLGTAPEQESSINLVSNVANGESNTNNVPNVALEDESLTSVPSTRITTDLLAPPEYESTPEDPPTSTVPAFIANPAYPALANSQEQLFPFVQIPPRNDSPW